MVTTKVALFAILLVTFVLRKEIQCYQVALVEYYYDFEVFSKLSPLELANRNAKIYDEIVGKIKADRNNIDLVVFPEATLVAEPRDNEVGRKGMTFVPSAQENVNPCVNSSTKYVDFLKKLSCTAQKYRTYLVINLKEKDSCQKNCSKPLNFYNTDVVFDRTGKVIARYRKYHPYLEADTDRPDEPEHVTFRTDFGKTFGIFTCFDLVYKSPAVDMVRDGVENFIYPTLWIPELPFHATIQIQQMWAHGNNVNLLTAGASYPRYGAGGLGVFLGNRDVADKNVLPRKDNYYLLRDVKDNYYSNSTCTIEVDDKTALEMDRYNLFIQNLSDYAYKKLPLASSNIINEMLCQKQQNQTFCCNFQIETKVNRSTRKKSYDYFLVVHSGLRTYGNKTYQIGEEICGLVACPGPAIGNCGQRFPNYNEIHWSVTFAKINITADFEVTETKKQFPNSLLADFSPLSPHCTTWERIDNPVTPFIIRQSFSVNYPVKKLLTFAIFGRNFALDSI